MSKVYEVKDGNKIIKIKANGLCDLEEKIRRIELREIAVRKQLEQLTKRSLKHENRNNTKSC